MNLRKEIKTLYIEYLNMKYDADKLKTMNIDIKNYKHNNKYKGVQKFRDNKYRVQFSNNNKIYSLGVFDNMELAAKKYAIIDKKIKGGKINNNSESKKYIKNNLLSSTNKTIKKKIINKSKSLKMNRSKFKNNLKSLRKCKSLKTHLKNKN